MASGLDAAGVVMLLGLHAARLLGPVLPVVGVLAWGASLRRARVAPAALARSLVAALVLEAFWRSL